MGYTGLMPSRAVRTVWECPFWRAEEEDFVGSDGVTRTWYSAKRPNPNTVHMLAITSDGMVPLLRQHRVAVGGWVWELPAGVCDVEGESYEDAALRELVEEAGLKAKEIHHLLTATVSPGLTDEMFNAYLCLDLEKINEGGGNPEERIEVHMTRFAELPKTIMGVAAKGELVDAKILAHFWLAVAKLKELDRHGKVYTV